MKKLVLLAFKVCINNSILKIYVSGSILSEGPCLKENMLISPPLYPSCLGGAQLKLVLIQFLNQITTRNRDKNNLLGKVFCTLAIKYLKD